MDTTIISLGGSIIIPDEIDVKLLSEFRKLIIEHVEAGNRVIIVTGGGSASRTHQEAAKKINPTVSKENLDWIGIAATKLNAHLVRALFGDLAYPDVLNDPTAHVDTDKPILIGSGFKPGCSSDKDTVQLAATYGARIVINLTNVDFVYDKNPSDYDDAEPITKMNWMQFREMFGAEWKPGLHSPFDPIAAVEAEKSGIKVIIVNGMNIPNLKEVLAGKKFTGTLIE